MLKELVFIRAISCITIVVAHVIAKAQYSADPGIYAQVLAIIYHFTLFATPAFIMLSEIGLTVKYGAAVPDSGLFKRIRFVLVPFFILSVFFALVDYEKSTGVSLLQSILLNFTGDWHGWFILMIVQFYLLRKWLLKPLKQFSPAAVLFSSFLVQSAFLGAIGYYQFTHPDFRENYFFARAYWVLFPGWLAFFYFGHFAGLNYRSVLEWIKAHKLHVAVLWAITLAISISVTEWSGERPFAKRFDVIFVCISSMALILSLFEHLQRFNKPLTYLAGFSFGVYLWHPFFLKLVKKSLHAAHLDIPVMFPVLMLVGTMLLTLAAIQLIKKIPGGYWLVGLPKPGTVRSE